MNTKKAMRMRTWKDNAAEFAALDRGEGWQFAVLVACSVDKKATRGGDRRSKSDRSLKVSTIEFAAAAGTSHSRVARYFDAWQEAATKGWVQDATDLRPEHAHSMTLPDKPWRAKDGGVYDASRTGGQINDVGQIADKAARDPEYARRVIGEIAKSNVEATQEAVRQAVREDPQIAGAAITGLDEANADFVASRPVNPEAKLDDARAEYGDMLNLIANLRRAHKSLAQVVALAQNIRGAGADDLREGVKFEIEWIRGACDVIETGLNGGPLDEQLRDLLDSEAGR